MSRWVQAAVTDVRCRRKCFSTTGSWLLLLTSVLFLLIPSGKSAEIATNGEKQAVVQYSDSDNIKFQPAKVWQRKHPIIMYKEDFVSEDYVEPAETKEDKPVREYKDIAPHRRRQNHAKLRKNPDVETKKIYFDILPETPIFHDDGPSDIDASKVLIDIVPMPPNLVSDDEVPNKQKLKKHPKKYHSRQRRDVREKRNPFINYQVNSQWPSNHVAPRHEGYYYYQVPKSHPVQGVLWNGIDRPVPAPPAPPMSINDRFGGADEEDRVVWDTFRPRTLSPLDASVQSIFHNSNPADADLSFTNRRPVPVSPTTMRPTIRTTPSIFHNSNTNDADLSFLTRPTTRPTPSTSNPNRRPQRPGSSSSGTNVALGTRIPQRESPITACVWAIVNCCSSRDQEVRYSCFEDQGCAGSFFDINPCGDFKDQVSDFVSQVVD